MTTTSDKNKAQDEDRDHREFVEALRRAQAEGGDASWIDNLPDYVPVPTEDDEVVATVFTGRGKSKSKADD